jgi:hypothetical protein
VPERFWCGRVSTVTSTTDDDARWAEAQSILDRTPTESAAQRLRRARRNRWFLVAGLVLVTGALAVLIVLFVVEIPHDRDQDVPTWRAVVGFTLSGLALIFMLGALVVQFRAARRNRAWGSPLFVLTRQQRKALLDQVRGRSPVERERVPLARHLAELLRSQYLALPIQAGMLVNFAGLWIVDHQTYRIVFVGVFVVLLLVGGVVARRQYRWAARFLEEHPAAGS